MKIIIFGYTGMLGHYLYTYLSNKYQVVGIGRADYDIVTDDVNKLEDILKLHHVNSNTLIINASGTIPQASKNHSLTDQTYIKVNSVFPNLLACLANKYNAKMVHSTTDCVYDGLSGDYCETDLHTATSTYGITKSVGEPSNCTVIRTSIVGEEVINQRSLLEWAKTSSGKEVNGYLNHYWNGITCLTYCKLIEYMIEHNLFWQGIRHIYSPTTVSKYELLKLMNKSFNLDLTINQYHDKVMCNRALKSNYGMIMEIPELSIQLDELATYHNTLFGV